MRKIRIFLIEDNRLLRDGIAAIIKGQADMHVVATSDGNENLLLRARTVRAQVILADLSNLQKVTSLAKKSPELKVIGMGLIPTQSDLVEFVQAGASGFIMKGATVKQFLATIRSVAHGENVLPPMLTDSLFSFVVDRALKNGKGGPIEAVRMTKREREIIALIADGLSNKDIAGRLNIATYTVKSHVHNVLEKLALHSRLQIANFAHDDEMPLT